MQRWKRHLHCRECFSFFFYFHCFCQINKILFCKINILYSFGAPERKIKITCEVCSFHRYLCLAPANDLRGPCRLPALCSDGVWAGNFVLGVCHFRLGQHKHGFLVLFPHPAPMIWIACRWLISLGMLPSQTTLLTRAGGNMIVICEFSGSILFLKWENRVGNSI